jgi:Spy/CpxP family protein refolding chaperone
MKKILLACSMMFAVMISAMAQDAPAKPQRGEGRGKEMKVKAKQIKEELNLSDKQVAEVKELRQWHKGTMKSIRSNVSLSKEQKKQQVQDANAKRDEKLKTILSPEQYQKLEGIKAKAREEHKAKKGGKGHGKLKGGESNDDDMGDLN